MATNLGQDKHLSAFTDGKSEATLALLDHLLGHFRKIGAVELVPTKTMIAVSHGERRIAWITQLGKNFVHVVFPFKAAYEDNLCFQKIALVPGSTAQYNHHFRMYLKEDVNAEVLKFMKLAFLGES